MTSGLTARTDLGQTPAPIIKSSRHNTSCFPMLRLGIVRLLCQQANVQLKHVAHPPAQGFSQGGPQMAAAAAAAAQMIKQCWAVPMLGQSHWQLQQSQQLHTSVCSAAPLSQHVVQLDRLRPAPGSSKLVRAVGCRYTPSQHPANVFALHPSVYALHCLLTLPTTLTC